MRTLAGKYDPLGTVIIKDMRLPVFNKNRKVSQHQFHVFEAACSYDVILGGYFLINIGMNLLYDKQEVEWFGNTIPMELL